MVTNTSSAVFHAVADPIRRRILDRLRRSPAETGRIARDFPVSRPAISRHLRILEEAGLLRGRRAGRKRVYTLVAGPLRRLEEWLAPFRELGEKPFDAPPRPAEAEGGERWPTSRSTRERSSHRSPSRRLRRGSSGR